jgi:hypothetical protein
MEITEYLELTPEQKESRKQKWEARQLLIANGKDPDEEMATSRAMKALMLLRQDREKSDLTSVERDTYAALVFSKSKDDFYFFAKQVLDLSLLTDQTHKRWCKDLQHAINLNKTRFMRLKPRGTYKSSLYGVAFILWIWACVSPELRIFYTSSNALLLEEVADALNQHIGTEKNDTLYSTIFGIIKDVNAKNTSEVFNVKGRRGKGFSLILRTSGGSTQGIHPNVIIVDDPIGQKDRTSQAERTEKERWFDTLQPLIVPWYDTKTNLKFASIFYIGTRWHFKDLVDYILKMDKKNPDHLRWDIEVESIYNAEGKSNYPELFSDEDILALKSSMTEEFWSCQYCNTALSEGLIIFDLKRLTFVRPEQIDLKQGRILCVFDPSLGKISSDYPAVWWVHQFENTITFIDAIDIKTELALLVHHIAGKNKQYGCRHLIFEDNGAILVLEHLKDAHAYIGHKMYIESVHHHSQKEGRIISMQPDLYSGFARFMSDYQIRYPEAMNQIVFYPVYGPDDFPDCAQIAVEYFRKPHFEFMRHEAIL